MNYVLDIVLILIVLISAIISAKKGFVKTLIELVGFVLAILVAFSASSVIANYIYTNMVEPVAVDSISSAISNAEKNILESVPPYISFFANKAGLTNESILSAGGTSPNEIAIAITETAIKPIAINIIKFIASLIIFVALLIVVKLIARLINSLFKGAILGTANKILGSILGIAKGCVYAFIFSIICALVVTISGDNSAYINESVIESTYICKHILSILPFGV